MNNSTFDVSALLNILDMHSIPEEYQLLMLEVMDEYEREIVAPIKTT